MQIGLAESGHDLALVQARERLLQLRLRPQCGQQLAEIPALDEREAVLHHLPFAPQHEHVSHAHARRQLVFAVVQGLAGQIEPPVNSQPEGVVQEPSFSSRRNSPPGVSPGCTSSKTASSSASGCSSAACCFHSAKPSTRPASTAMPRREREILRITCHSLNQRERPAVYESPLRATSDAHRANELARYRRGCCT